MVAIKFIRCFANRRSFEIGNIQQHQDSTEQHDEKINWFLYLTTIVVNLASIASGAALAWPSTEISKMKTPLTDANNPLSEELTPAEERWITSFLPIGALFGAASSGCLYPSIGKKKTVLITIIPIIVSDIVVAFSKDVNNFYIGRFLAGMSVGAMATVIPIHLCEIAEIKNRGALGCMYSTFLSFGNMYGCIVGPCLSITAFSLSSLWASVLFFVSFPFFPDTSSYTVSPNQIIRALNRLPMFPTIFSEEGMLEIEATTSRNRGDEVWQSLDKKSFRKGLLICLSLIVFQQLSGVSLAIFYMESIFNNTTTSISWYVCTVAMAMVQTIFCMLAAVIVDKLGRKFLLIVSAAGTALALMLLGSYFYLETIDVNMESFRWLAIGSVFLHIASYNIGLGPVPFALLGEIFPPTPIASTISTVTCLSLTFFNTEFLPDLTEMIGQHYLFWFLAMIMLAAIVFIVTVVPETKGKSLKEIIVLLGK